MKVTIVKRAPIPPPDPIQKVILELTHEEAHAIASISQTMHYGPMQPATSVTESVVGDKIIEMSVYTKADAAAYAAWPAGAESLRLMLTGISSRLRSELLGAGGRR